MKPVPNVPRTSELPHILRPICAAVFSSKWDVNVPFASLPIFINLEAVALILAVMFGVLVG